MTADPPSSPPTDQRPNRFGRRRDASPPGREAQTPSRGFRVWPTIGAAAVVLIGVLVLGAVWLQTFFLYDMPAIPGREALWAIRRSPSMTFVDHNGGLIATRGARYGERVRLKDLPVFVPQAFLAAEDRRFYSHGPVDFHAIARAAQRNVAAGRTVEGASTLSQQLARTLFLTPDHNLKRKVQEAVLAERLEGMLGKDQVLELYLNRTFFGDGAYGLDAAARTYFGKSARELTLSQAAILAALPNAPTRLALTNDLPAAWARGRRILRTMLGEGWITPDAEAAAEADQPVLAASRNGEGEYSYILDQAAAEAGAVSGGASDLVVRLTIDPKLQALGLDTVRQVVLTQGRHRGVSQGALVTLAPDGAIRAMVGGLDHAASAFNRVTQARRQPGSSFKAFVYGAAMEHGVTPDDVRHDSPVRLGDWTPANYGGHYAGTVTVQQALARSINTVSVRLTLEVGPAQVAALARRFGLSTIPEQPGPSIALGAYEVTLLQLAGGYQVFQNGGGRTTPYLIESVTDTRGDVVYSHPNSAPLPVYDQLYAARMVRMLKTVITAGTGTGANIGRPAAGKTGTSQNWRDAWFIGFTPDLLTGVWVGNDDNRPMAKVTGGELPAEIWRRFMTAAEKATPATDFPWLANVPESALIETSADTSAAVEDGASAKPYEDEPPNLDAGADARPAPGDAGAVLVDRSDPRRASPLEAADAPPTDGPPPPGRDRRGFGEPYPPSAEAPDDRPPATGPRPEEPAPPDAGAPHDRF